MTASECTDNLLVLLRESLGEVGVAVGEQCGGGLTHKSTDWIAAIDSSTSNSAVLGNTHYIQ